MARVLGTGGHYARNANWAGSGGRDIWPIAIFMRFRMNNNVQGNLFSISRSDGTSNIKTFAVDYITDTNRVRYNVLHQPIEVQITFGSGLTLGAWHSILVVSAAGNDHYAYCNSGTKGATSSASISSFQSCSEFVVNGLMRSSGSITDVLSDTSFADIAVWSAALVDDEALALCVRGYSPSLIRPTALVEHWPMWGKQSPEVGTRQRIALTVASSWSAADQPRTLLPAGPV